MKNYPPTWLIALAAALLLALTACNKKEIKPTPTAPEPWPLMFNYEVKGFVNEQPGHTVLCPDRWGNVYDFTNVLVVDSCAVTVNGVLTSTETMHYHKELKVGDVVTFYVQGTRDSSAACAFNIWQDTNHMPEVVSYTASGSVLTGTFIVKDFKHYN